MVKKQYTAGESLNQIRLRMIYNSSKTLNENRDLVTEQANTNLEYFETAAKSLMNDPSQIKSINFGNPTTNVKNAVTAIKNSVNGVGTDLHGLDYILQKGFNNISNSIAIIKSYPETGGESLFDALNGEWFDGGTMDKIVNQVATQLMGWCNGKKNIGICTPKTKDELKYGKL
jgi:hypothetical protein